MRNLGLGTLVAAALLCSAQLGCGKSDDKNDKEPAASKSPAADETKNDTAAEEKPPVADDQPPAATGDEATTIDRWVSMWEAVAQAGTDIGGDCDKTAAAWTKLFKANRTTFQAIIKLGDTYSEDELTAKFGARVKEPMATFMEITNKCGKTQSMMNTLQTMNKMYVPE